MKSEGKSFGIAAKIEIAIAALLFVVMILTCGMYINIKMNGRSSSLPVLSEMDKKTLLRSAASENIYYADDIIEPTFVGVKKGDFMIAACPDNSARRSVEVSIYSSLLQLFGGRSEKTEFEGAKANEAYIENLKNSQEYMLVSFYDDIPSTVFLPCISDRYETESDISMFYVKNLFLLPDADGKLYAISVSGENEVNLIYPSESIEFSKIIAESYDISDGFSYFEYEKEGVVTPVLTSSFYANKYRITPLAVSYGKEKDSRWIEELFDIFSFNPSLVKEYTSKNETQINFVENEKEMLVSDDGAVEFKVSDGNGVHIEEFLGFFPDGGEGYTFGDRIFAVKALVNMLNFGDNTKSFCITGVDFDAVSNKLSVYLKCLADGILVTQNKSDAVFVFEGDYLTYVSFYCVNCEKTEDYSLVLPQKYSNVLIDDTLQNSELEDENMLCAVLSPDVENNKEYVLKWAKTASERVEVAE